MRGPDPLPPLRHGHRPDPARGGLILLAFGLLLALLVAVTITALRGLLSMSEPRRVDLRIIQFPCACSVASVVCASIPIQRKGAPMPPPRTTAENYRARAEELRANAEEIEHANSRALLLRCADDYERLAASADAIHRSAEIVRIRFGGAA